jgi:hypothetical protein
MTLDDFQVWAVEEAEISSICTEDGAQVILRPEDTLNGLTLRVTDAREGRLEWLWDEQDTNADPREDVKLALKDLLIFLSRISDQHGIWLSDALGETHRKLSTRKRNPHVIDEAAPPEMELNEDDPTHHPEIIRVMQHLAVFSQL